MSMGYFTMSAIKRFVTAILENISTLEVIINAQCRISAKMISRPYQSRKGNTNVLHVNMLFRCLNNSSPPH